VAGGGRWWSCPLLCKDFILSPASQLYQARACRRLDAALLIAAILSGPDSLNCSGPPAARSGVRSKVHDELELERVLAYDGGSCRDQQRDLTTCHHVSSHHRQPDGPLCERLRQKGSRCLVSEFSGLHSRGDLDRVVGGRAGCRFLSARP